MQVTKGEKKAGGNSGPKQIGFFKGTLKYVNPTAQQLKEIYQMDEEPEEVKYQGTDKNDKDWSLINLVFEEELSKTPISYRVFVSKEVAEFEVDGKTRTWYLNQWGEAQLVYDKKDLFKSFTNVQVQNEAKEWVDAKDESGNVVELQWRKAYKGETALYGLLKKLVNKGRYEWNITDNLFIPIDKLMRGSVGEITGYIGTDTFQPVVGCIEIQAKDGDNGINYYQNCVDQAWMPGFRIKDANIATSSNSWNKYEDKANGKGKNRDMYEFYQAIKRNKHITDLKYLHEFTGQESIAAGNQAIQHSEAPDNTDY